ncbi:hypothetical protein ARMGADRAFT_1074851 [Armillaria gallica]|uniref:Uncharacterized protein n=1 Tax=Armillaria gallica TaxID=47427 RepID=A0A2H3E8I7_ARMGA|nr:hypothetical protein ARMGADRAFT_1074851 [Armillaria gallica]
MDTEVEGYVEKHFKTLRDDFSLDDVFGKYFTQDTIQREIIQSFEEMRGTDAVHLSFT